MTLKEDKRFLCVCLHYCEGNFSCRFTNVGAKILTKSYFMEIFSHYIQQRWNFRQKCFPWFRVNCWLQLAGLATGGPSTRWEEIIYVKVRERCDLQGFVWELLRVCFKYLNFNVLWIKLTYLAFLSYSLLFHGVWGYSEAFSASSEWLQTSWNNKEYDRKAR